jgi:hypothetical protein
MGCSFSIIYIFPQKKRKEHLVNGTRILPSGSLVGGGEREREREITKPNQTKPHHNTTLVKGRAATYLVMNLQIYSKILIIT